MLFFIFFLSSLHFSLSSSSPPFFLIIIDSAACRAIEKLTAPSINKRQDLGATWVVVSWGGSPYLPNLRQEGSLILRPLPHNCKVVAVAGKAFAPGP